MSEYCLQKAYDAFKDILNGFIRLHESAQFDLGRIDAVLLRLLLIEKGPGARLFTAPPASDAEVDLWVKEVGLVLVRVGNLYKEAAEVDKALWEPIGSAHRAFFVNIKRYKRARDDSVIPPTATR